MKKLLIILILFAFKVQAQNLVPNGNFENYTSCPSAFSQTNLVPPWRQYHPSTSDFFHTCGTGTQVVAPNTFFGYQVPASGNGYGGGYAYTSPPPSFPASYTEYLASPIAPMVKGLTYEISMSVSLANKSGTGCNGLGVFLYDIGPSTTVATLPISTLPFTPQVSFSSYGPIVDTQNWVRVSSLFYADSAYDNIVIGMFWPTSGFATAPAGGTSNFSYYFIDSVVIKLPEPVILLPVDTMYCAGDSFNLQYIASPPCNAGNIFTVQLSDPNGSFASGTTTIGTKTAATSGTIGCKIPLSIIPGTKYRMRLLSSSPAFTSQPNPKDISIGILPQNFNASVNTPVCEGDSIKLNAASSTQDVLYAWTGPAGFSSANAAVTIQNVQISHSGKYIVTASLLHCKVKDTLDVTVHSYPELTAVSNAPVCIHDSLVLTATTNMSSATLIWSGPAAFSSSKPIVSIPDFKHNNAGIYTVRVNNMGCQRSIDITADIIDVKLDLGKDSVLCTDETRLLKADVASIASPSYLWQDGSTGNEYTVRQQGIYHLSVSTLCGVYTDTVNMDYEKCDCSPFVPSAFTPNNDTRNDKVGPIIDCDPKQYKFIIVNRFGEAVFKSDDRTKKWDGMYNGVPAEIGTYFYLLQISTLRGKDFLFKGDITLIR